MSYFKCSQDTSKYYPFWFSVQPLTECSDDIVCRRLVIVILNFTRRSLLSIDGVAVFIYFFQDNAVHRPLAGGSILCQKQKCSIFVVFFFLRNAQTDHISTAHPLFRCVPTKISTKIQIIKLKLFIDINEFKLMFTLQTPSRIKCLTTYLTYEKSMQYELKKKIDVNDENFNTYLFLINTLPYTKFLFCLSEKLYC